MTAPRKILVAGALGHIGSFVVRDFARRYPGIHFVMIDDLSAQRYVSLFDLPKTATYEFIEANVATADLEKLLRGCDAALQLAAITNAEKSFENQVALEQNNFRATQRVAEACVETGVPILFPSTTSVYGTQESEVDEDCPLADLKPQSPYAETKLREEALVGEWSRTRGLRAVACRFGTIFGVSPGMRFHTAVNKFCWQAATGRPLTVWRTAYEQLRPYLALEDAANAIAFFIERALWDGRIYNVVSSNHSVADVVAAIRAHVPDVKVEFVDSRIMNQLSYAVRNTRMDALGFSCRGVLADGVRDTLRLLGDLRPKGL